jgi:transposase
MKYVMGIDVGKAELVIYAFGNYYTISNTKKDINLFLKKQEAILKRLDLIVFEATGGYERCLRDCIIEKNYPYHLAHPNNVRDFAKSEGYMAKTDKLDAKVIALFGEKSGKAVAEKSLPEASVQQIRSLLDRREQLLGENTREQNRLQLIEDKYLKASIKRHIKWINEELKRIDEEIKNKEKHSPEIHEKIVLLKSIPGVGDVIAQTIIGYLPEIEDCDEKSIAALAGVAPMNKDSGKCRKRRKIQGGRSAIRRVLYMGALTATRHHAEIKVFFERLRLKGKPYKVAITAAMRKLLIMIQSVLKRGTPWLENFEKKLAI